MVMRPVRKSGSQASLPKTDAVNQAMAVATTAEAANYLYEQFLALVKQAGLEGNPLYQKAVSVIGDFAKYVGLATSGGEPWSGKVPPTAFQNVQQGLAAASAAKINIEKPIRFDFAVSDASEFVKAYSVDGKPVDKVTEHAMNEQLLGWLASDKNPASKNQADKLLVVNHGGTLYVFDEKDNDKIKKIDGKPVLADPAAINKMMVDPKYGFAAFVQKTNQAAKIDIHSHDYSVHHTAEQEPASPAQGA
jgi:hypothetical protein